MTLERVQVGPKAALRMLGAVHRRPGRPPQARAVRQLVGQMLAADEACEMWEQTAQRRIVLSEDHPGRPAGVILGVEVLLAVVYTGFSRSLLVERDVPLGSYLDEVEPEVGPAVADNGTELTTELTISTWVEDPGPTTTP